MIARRQRRAMIHQIDDVRIENIRPLMAPEILLEDLPVSEAHKSPEGLESLRRVVVVRIIAIAGGENAACSSYAAQA